MKTSQYDTNTRRQFKRHLRNPLVLAHLEAGRGQRVELEALLVKRTAEIAQRGTEIAQRDTEIRRLREEIQRLIDAGTWDQAWIDLGFKKPSNT